MTPPSARVAVKLSQFCEQSPRTSGHHRIHVPQLDNLVGAGGEQVPGGGLVVHVNNAVLAVVEGGCGRSVLVGDGLVAAVAHTHLELKAHEGDGGALGRTLAAHCLAALPAVVLSQANLLAVPHLFEVPEERLLTLLTGVTVQPLWSLLSRHVHVPDDDASI